MDQQLQDRIRSAYGWKEMVMEPVSSGLINSTWKIHTGNDHYLLQKINTHVFRNPQAIDANLQMLDHYLRQHAPGYLFTAPVVTRNGEGLLVIDEEHYRVFRWVEGSHTIDVAENPAQAYEAASQFGRFTALLEGFDAGKLHTTLPDFHNLTLRYLQFEQAVQNGNPERIQATAETIQYIRAQNGIVARYEAFIQHPDARIRVTHHDTKISNVLFDNNDNGLCVIDLDTVMPGYFLSDVGDIFRTYTCPVSEEEADLDRIHVRREFMDAIEQGYLSAMGATLTGFEKDHFYFAGEMLIYMQAIRFLADYLNNDSYYGCRYPDQNLVRAKNQIHLLTAFQESR